MKKFIFAAIAVIAVLTLALCIDAQPAGGGGAGGGMGGFGGGAGGGMGGFGGGAGGGTRGARGLRARPDKAARLASFKELEKQVAALKAAVEKGPATEPNMSKLEGAELTKFMDTYTVESNAINAINATLASLTSTGGGMGRNAAGGPTEEVLTELNTLAKGEKATKTAARIDALIQEAQTRATRGGAGGGAGGGRGGRGGAGGA
jgi:hypothetical protein